MACMQAPRGLGCLPGLVNAAERQAIPRGRESEEEGEEALLSRGGLAGVWREL